VSSNFIASLSLLDDYAKRPVILFSGGGCNVTGHIIFNPNRTAAKHYARNASGKCDCPFRKTSRNIERRGCDCIARKPTATSNIKIDAVRQDRIRVFDFVPSGSISPKFVFGIGQG
jgi:hypothetical protein